MSSHSFTVSRFDDFLTPTGSPRPVGTSADASNSVDDGDEDSGHIVCAWCQKIGSKMFSLRTVNGFKAFCSELCFAQCRRASFKKNKVCDWCKHVRHTVNYVDFHNGDQSLQFCSDKCLNQYKMNIFCRETQAHLSTFSAIYRSPSPPSSNCFSINNFRSTNESPESDKDNSKGSEAPSFMPSDIWLRNSTYKGATSSNSPSPSSLSSSPPPSSTSTSSCCRPSSPPLSLPQNPFQSSSMVKCSEGICDIKPSLSTDLLRFKETLRKPEALTKPPGSKPKVAHSRELKKKSKIDSHAKTTNKQRESKIHRNLNHKQEDILDSIKHASGTESPKVVPSSCGSTLCTHPSPFSTRTALNQPTNHSVEDKRLENSVNCGPTFANFPNEASSGPSMRIPHFPLPPHPQFLPPFRTDFPQFRPVIPMFPFNQPNLLRLPGHRPSMTVHHLPFPCHPHLHDCGPSLPPQQFQPSPGMGQSLPSNSFNYPSQLSVPVPHPFLFPLPMPIPLPIPFPIKFNSTSNLKSLISTEDKEVQVQTDKLLPRFQFDSGHSNDVGLSKPIISVPERDNQTRFRIDTLMNRLIDRRMRAMNDSPDQQSLNIHGDCSSDEFIARLERPKGSGPAAIPDSRITNEYHDDPSFRRAKRLKRDILSN